LWVLKCLEKFRKSRKGFKTIVTCSYMLAPSCFIPVHMSMFSITSTFAYNSNLSLESFTYNLIAKKRKSINSQYSWCQLTIHVVIIGKNAFTHCLNNCCVYVKGILLVKPLFDLIVTHDNCNLIGQALLKHCDLGCKMHFY
jgi:hypothetical protein